MSNRCFFTIVGFAALLVYTNSLIGDFTFDDNFAVINNSDVTNDASPLLGLLKHDFWGQDIISPQSHKSYRPITVLAFRWTRQAWSLLCLVVPGLEAAIPAAPPVLTQQQAVQQAQEQLQVHDKPARPKGLHPFPFHAVSVCLHALVSMMVLALAQHLFAQLEHGTEAAAAVRTGVGAGKGGATAAAAAQSSQYSTVGCGGGPWLQQQPALWLQPVSQHSGCNQSASGCSCKHSLLPCCLCCTLYTSRLLRAS